MEGYDPDLSRATDVTTRFEPGQQEATHKIRVETNDVTNKFARRAGKSLPWFGGFNFRGVSSASEPVTLEITMAVEGETAHKEGLLSEGGMQFDPPDLQRIGTPCPSEGPCERSYQYTFRLSEPWHGDEPLRIRWRFVVVVQFPQDSPLPEGASMEAWLDGHPIPPGQ